MFRFTELSETNNFRIIQVDYYEVRGFSGPDKSYSNAIMFDRELNKWVKYHGEMNKINTFLNQSRDVIYSTLNNYKQPLVSDYLDARLSEYSKDYEMRWLNNICLPHIGQGWTREWKD
jgi:hypothetical protein